MKKIFLFVQVFIISISLLFNANASSVKEATVSYVIDGDTFSTEKGERVRLLHINTPEIGYKGKKSQPFAKKAKEELEKLILGKEVLIKLPKDGRKVDKYGRLLGQVYLKNNFWINKHLISKGLAHVYTFPDNRKGIAPLIQAEKKAREKNLGIWSHKRWKVKKATDKFNDNLIGTFQLVEGTVVSTAKVKGKIYLNFGKNWKTDFSVEIPAKFKKNFSDIKEPLTKYYKGKKLLVRGFLKPVNGVLVTATHPEQLTVISN